MGTLSRTPKDHVDIRILQTMISGLLLIWVPGARMSDPYDYVVFWASIEGCSWQPVNPRNGSNLRRQPKRAADFGNLGRRCGHVQPRVRVGKVLR